jgi:hypothetical protein
MSLSPLQQQQQQQQVSQLLNFNQLTIQTNDYPHQHQNFTSTILAPIGNGLFKTTTSPLNNLLNTSPLLHQQQQHQLQPDHEETSTSSSASSTHSISSSSNSSIKDEHLLTLSPLMTGQPNQQPQRNINTLLSSAASSGDNSSMPNKCDLCKDLIINNTKLLWGCYHIYCSSCVERLQVASSPNSSTSTHKTNIITCPLCSHEIRIVDTTTTSTTTNDIGDFLTNNGYDFSLINLLNENKMKQQQQQQQQQLQNQQRCQNCKFYNEFF